MLTLKIMSGEDKPDNDANKLYRLVANVENVRFVRDTNPTKFERKQLGIEPNVTDAVAFFAIVSRPHVAEEERYLLTGNCYVLNEHGKTVDTLWVK